jgi:hypothetical protein
MVFDLQFMRPPVSRLTASSYAKDLKLNNQLIASIQKNRQVGGHYVRHNQINFLIIIEIT